jgi:hypothetical protein
MGMRVLRGFKWAAALAVATVGFISPNLAHADKLIKGEDFSLTFPTGWDTVQSANVVGKYGGISGMATLGATEGTTLPNLDSMAASFADSLGGHITKDANGTMNLGSYTVNWQQFKYDSLPKLSAQISAATGLQINLRDGSFRVYYLVSDGFVFNLALMAVLPGGIPPYADVEKAIATLKLGAKVGIISLARGPGRDLWIRGGRLGGEWLKTNRVFAVDCYDSRGAKIGAATHGAEGTWILPASRQEMFVLLRTAYGTSEHFTVHPW